ncbi:RNA-binding protein 43 [Bagarius yarrelli]|uniref:RNA-binding protein 43 n=1 Tax=Bagarius yarrelli TaxID=175774 RepID=A0A556TP27_BAGYA|nr:RNA-binding protein 43 [Bagarius yarrelli]
MELSVIEVLGVPQVSPHDRMADQLKMHFLKRRNCGGDVLLVIYPTSTPGQAYVVFETDKVPGVLKCTHILDVHNRFYPIRVKKADLSMVDMPVETTLHLSLFPNHESVRKLLESYDFTITEDIPGRVQLKGSFLKLKLLRTQLIQLLCHDHHRFRPSSALHNGYSLGYELERNHPESRLVSKSISRNVRDVDAVSQQELLVSAPSSTSFQVSGSSGSPRIPQTPNSFYNVRNASSLVDAVAEEYQKQSRNQPVLAHGRRPCADGASSNPSAHNLLQQYKDFASTGSTSHAADTMHTSHEDLDSSEFRRCLSSDASSSSSSGGVSSIYVATDIINFIQTQHKDVIQKIRKNNGTKIEVQADAEVATVTFSGKNSKKAQACLLNTIYEITPSLITQKINLKNFDRAKQLQILERIERNRDRGVMITQCHDVIKLVGTSKESFEMMQVLLGHNDELSRGRPMERSSKVRRSSSLPRLYKMTQNFCSTDPEPQASVPIQYNPSHYQEKPDEGKVPQIGPGFERTCSKNMEQRVHQDTELPLSSPGKTSQRKSLKQLLDSGLQVLPIKKKDFLTRKQTRD